MEQPNLKRCSYCNGETEYFSSFTITPLVDPTTEACIDHGVLR